MSNYNGYEFLGFAACSPTLIPNVLYTHIFCPQVEEENGAAKFAPCGTRKIEAALLERGFDVKVIRPQDLNKAITKDTKVLGITTNDPLGLGPASTTLKSLIGKETYSSLAFRDLVLNPLIKKHDVKVVVGGPGAWQLEDEKILAKFGIDCVLIGEGEITAVEIFEKALRDEKLPKIVHGEVVPVDLIPFIKNPTINGLVEIARGCGRGCRFCNPNMLNYRWRPIDDIMKEIKVNVTVGLDALLHAEDVLRYGTNSMVPDKRKVLKLFKEVLKLTNRVGISHFSLASALSSPSLIQELSELLDVGSKECPWISGQVGIETGSSKIIKEYMPGKALPFKPEEWPEVVIEAHKLLRENHWVPCSTLIIGFAKEKQDDVIKTIELVQDLKEYKSLIVPLFFVPVGILRKEKFFRMKDMLPEHWMLLAECMKHNFTWIYELMNEHLCRMNYLKRIVVRSIVRIFERKLEPYLKVMEDGLSPYF
jgi:radical SAM superfamily enzyme YgiQ (UPF0313 family)